MTTSNCDYVSLDGSISNNKPQTIEINSINSNNTTKQTTKRDQIRSFVLIIMGILSFILITVGNEKDSLILTSGFTEEHGYEYTEGYGQCGFKQDHGSYKETWHTYCLDRNRLIDSETIPEFWGYYNNQFDAYCTMETAGNISTSFISVSIVFVWIGIGMIIVRAVFTVYKRCMTNEQGNQTNRTNTIKNLSCILHKFVTIGKLCYILAAVCCIAGICVYIIMANNANSVFGLDCICYCYVGGERYYIHEGGFEMCDEYNSDYKLGDTAIFDIIAVGIMFLSCVMDTCVARYYPK
eukprot:144627_1